ncbi:MAG TPA: molybdenum cofactor guanylyltransferase [Bacteroidales bacterium]|nr:molybdenum cofactor guanylyltransferase [Bacteroidales bacterium]HSA42837.1 molybdenum cofactor guanylyltransferase [Bacteroidales bacterium]
MNKPEMSVTGIILSGGKSSRFRQDKGLFRLMGKSLAERAAETLRPLCSHILVSTGNPAYQALGFQTVSDLVPACGPMMGIYSCLKQSHHMHHLVLSVDTPLVGTAFLAYLLSCSSDAQIVAAGFANEHYEPLIGYYHRDVIPAMEKQFSKGNYKLPDLFRHVAFREVRPGNEQFPFHPDMFRNINSEEDIAAVIELLRKA